LDLPLAGLPRLVPASGDDVLDDAMHRVQLLVACPYLAGAAEDDHGPVVHRMVVDGAGEHEPVEQRDRDAYVDALSEVAQHAAPGGAVKVEDVAVAGVDGRDHEGLSID